jgi:hypothetical protein
MAILKLRRFGCNHSFRNCSSVLSSTRNNGGPGPDLKDTAEEIAEKFRMSVILDGAALRALR